MIETIEAMLTMLDKEHGIVIDDNIGLIADGLKNESEGLKLEYVYRGVQQVYDKKGDTFTVIDGDACVLFDYKVNFTGIVKDKDSKVVGYVFRLNDFYARNDIEDFFDSFYDTESKKYDAFIFYDCSKLYINEIEDEELYNIFDKVRNIELNGDASRLLLNDIYYIASILDSTHKIYEYNQLNINL